jgi:cysteine desulfuration protein SufE
MGELRQRPHRQVMPTPPATPKLDALLALFDEVTDLDERSALLIDYAGRFREVPPDIAQRPFPESRRVPYCESEAFVWVLPRPDRTLALHFAVENPSGISAKALGSILQSTLSGSTPEQVASVSPDIVERIFRQNISMGKGMGLMGIVEAVRNGARTYTRNP